MKENEAYRVLKYNYSGHHLMEWKTLNLLKKEQPFPVPLQAICEIPSSPASKGRSGIFFISSDNCPPDN